MRIPFLRPKAANPANPAKAPPERARPAPMGDDPSEVQAARTQARRRLVGAVVLLLIGVVGFPVLFETQPRPLPMDTPIEAPRRDSVVSGLTGKDVAPPAARPPPVLPELPAAAGVEEAPAAAAVQVASAPAPVRVAAAPVAPRSASAVAPAPASTPAPAPAPAASRAAVTAAQLPAAPPAEAGRYVVQAGAYSEAGKLREARAKIEKLGLKTYTQVVDTEQGSRTRVRVGPYATRAEAEAVAAKVKHSGLPAAILAL